MGVGLAAFPFMIHDERRCKRYPYTMFVKGAIQGIWGFGIWNLAGKGIWVSWDTLTWDTKYSWGWASISYHVIETNSESLWALDCAHPLRFVSSAKAASTLVALLTIDE